VDRRELQRLCGWHVSRVSGSRIADRRTCAYPVSAEPRRVRGPVDGLDQTAARVMPKPVRMDIGHVRPSAELGEHVLDVARGVRSAFAVEDGTAGLLKRPA
jgi:hypothetical protein